MTNCANSAIRTVLLARAMCNLEPEVLVVSISVSEPGVWPVTCVSVQCGGAHHCMWPLWNVAMWIVATVAMS